MKLGTSGFYESLMCFIEDKDPKSCIDRLRPLIDEGPENLKAHGRLLMVMPIDRWGVKDSPS